MEPQKAEPQRNYVNILAGDPVPWFHGRTFSNPTYAFDTAAGRYIVLCFFMSAGDAPGQGALKAAFAHHRLFDDQRFCFFGVSCDPGDETEKRIADKVPGFRFFLDFDASISRQFGATPRDVKEGERQVPARRFWLVLDPMMRAMKAFAFEPDGSDREKVFRYLAQLPDPNLHAGFEIQAPVLLLPNIFENGFCQQLIELYERNGGEESGFMREVDGKTVMIHDHGHKRRRDYIIEDEQIMNLTRERIRRRIAPEIFKVHNFTVTRMERYIVCCYLAEDGGHFNAHRDNTTKGTAHRRYAVSINLNAEFEGGEISFPEYGSRSYKPPVGGACVFSCSLLHKVSPVTRGRRYAFLPFLYDEAASKIREANNQFLGEGVGAYKHAS